LERGLALSFLAALAIVAGVAAGGLAGYNPPVGAGVEVHGPLEAFNLTGCFYRDMNISLTLQLTNMLSPASPSWCPSWGPVDGSVTCSCSLLPGEWWPNSTWSLTLGPGGGWRSIVYTRVPATASLGRAWAGFSCSCSYLEWCETTIATTVSSPTTTTECALVPPCEGYCTSSGTLTCCICTTYTTTVTTTTTTLTSTAYVDTGSRTRVTVLPRHANSTLLPVELNVTGYRPLGGGGVLANITVRLYNLGLGLRSGNTTPIPVEEEMLLLHNLTVLLDNMSAINLTGYGAPARAIPVNASIEPSAAGSVELTLTPPGRPTNEYTFNITVCLTEDKPEPVRTCISGNITLPLPFGWRLIRYVADDCRVLDTVWEVVPANETGVHVELVEDRVKPSITTKGYCITASAGACELLRLQVYEDGSQVASREGRGSVTWCPVEPGVYTAVAVDSSNNTATGTYTLTWTAGPPPALKRALQGLAGAIIALMVGLYIMLGEGGR